MRPARAILAVLAAATLAGCGSLDSPDLVHDLRLLAQRADPADQVFNLPINRDGGGLFDADGGVDPNAIFAISAALSSVQPITVTSLIADPDGGGRSIHYQYAICAKFGDGGRCDLTEQNSYALSEGDLVPDGGWAELPVTFTPKLELMAAALSDDPYFGAGGFITVPVQLHIKAGDEEVYGYKRLVFTIVLIGDASQTPNQNPYIPALNLDGDIWSDTLPPVLVDRRAYDIAPVIPTAAEEAYSRPLFTGGEISFHESWRYNFFATAGGFSSFGSGGSSNIGSGDNPTDSKWTPKASDGPQNVTYFVVVRDGRGGEGWTVRTAQFAPTVPAKK
ncbi:MAG: hypothetical protein JST54_01095 [Deltaproteobacteria bacterium]|nr:hypothetical protein [Deltaproteobacteria bacterium]